MDKKNRGFFVVYHSLKSFVFFIIFFSLRISLSVFFNCIMHRAVKQFRERNHTECSIEIITFFSLQFKCERVREREHKGNRKKCVATSLREVLQMNFFPPRPHADFKGFDFNDDIIHVLFYFFFVKTQLQLTKKILCMLRLRNSLICLFLKINKFENLHNTKNILLKIK